MQQNCKCRLWGDRDETINHIISECSKLARKVYNTRYDWVGKVIHNEMFKKFQFDHMNKWYMHNPDSVQENDACPMGLWHANGSPNLGQKTWPHDNQQKKENLQNCGLYCPGWPQNKTEGKWNGELVPRPCQGIEKTMEHAGDNYTNRYWCFLYSHQRIIKGTGGLGCWRTSWDHPNNIIIEKDQNTEKSPGH